MANKLNIASIQTAILWESPQGNIKKYSSMIDSISEDIDLIILPEMFATGFSRSPKKCAESMNGISVSWMKQIAGDKNTAIMGSLIIKESGNYFNRLVFIHPNGSIETYDKRHLFTFAGEDKVYTAGAKRTMINYKGWKIFPLICYDLRFPVWSRNDDNFDLLVYIANWPKSRIYAWDTLLKARAIENMCYTIGVNRIGSDENNLEYVGHTQTIDMLGKVISDSIENKEMMVESTLNKKDLITTREKFQFLNDKDSFSIKK
ncbi:MAG: amidohydrolase [Flavobacteriaceae bacterium]|nr:amidohydrolase [Flavobacteriaceae bacterium]